MAIVVGTIIGAGVFQSAPLVAQNAGSTGAVLLLWGTGGALSLIGALCFAELASRFRHQVGGDWVYLREAFGPRVAFLFAWAAFWVIRPGNIGSMSLTFADYAGQLVDLNWLRTGLGKVLLADGAVLLLVAINWLGLRYGAGTLRLLTLVKVVGIVGIALIGFSGGSHDAGAGLGSSPSAATAVTSSGLLLAMVMVMYAYGGWNDVSFVVGEIRHPQRNVLWALMGGTLLVTLLYVAINASFLSSLGLAGVQSSQTVATDSVANGLARWGWAGTIAGKCTSLLVCISCLGAVNAMLITSPRIFFAAIGDWPRFGNFLAGLGSGGKLRASLLATGGLTVFLLVLTAWQTNMFEAVTVVTAPWFWTFLALVPLALIVIRWRQPSSDGYRTTLYPLPPLILILVCCFMAWSAVNYISVKEYGWPAIAVVGLMLAGGLVSLAVPAGKGGVPRTATGPGP